MGKVASLLELIDRNIRVLDEKVDELGVAPLLKDYFYLNSVLHLLQVASQALLELVAHVCAEAGVGIPKSYRDLGRLSESAGALTKEEARLLEKIAGFRNVVVHGYCEISREILEEILAERKYRDIGRLALRVAEWARERGLDP